MVSSCSLWFIYCFYKK